MSARTSIFSLLLLTAVTGTFAQSQPVAADPLSSRPLNLSVRKPSATPAGTVLILPDQAVPASNAATIDDEDEIAPADLPYGAGYENRQQGSKAGSGSATGSGNSGSSGGSGNSNGGGGGGGGGGRGGSGRGR